ncbi:hypothetical protein BDV06DRAFT_210424 [Aspergillus oleicola]
MRSSLRLLNLEVSTIQGSRTRYVCSTCRQEARPRPFVACQFLRNASDSSTPITERVRRKIWGTDNPPGLKDPYGGEGVFEKKWKKSQAGAEEGGEDSRQRPAETKQAAKEEEPVEEVTSGDYEAATTWEGLDRVGHLGRWKDLPPKKADAYNSFVQHRLTSPGHLAIAAHQTAIELSLMDSTGRQLTGICEVVEHEKPIFDLIYNTRIVYTNDTPPKMMIKHLGPEAKEALHYVFSQIGSPDPAKQTVEDVEKTEKQAEVADASAPTPEFESAQESEPEPAQSSSPVPFFGYEDIKDKGVLKLNLPIKMRFAYLKRFTQLTGHRIPDPLVAEIKTVQDLLNYLNKELALKPKKLGEHLVANQKLTSLPNVKISVKKVKPHQKDEEMGRKKIIDAELRKRGLVY